jgi:hypothetical protein
MASFFVVVLPGRLYADIYTRQQRLSDFIWGIKFQNPLWVLDTIFFDSLVTALVVGMPLVFILFLYAKRKAIHALEVGKPQKIAKLLGIFLFGVSFSYLGVGTLLSILGVNASGLVPLIIILILIPGYIVRLLWVAARRSPLYEKRVRMIGSFFLALFVVVCALSAVTFVIDLIAPVSSNHGASSEYVL